MSAYETYGLSNAQLLGVLVILLGVRSNVLSLLKESNTHLLLLSHTGSLKNLVIEFIYFFILSLQHFVYFVFYHLF